jgi:glutathione S-transferase
MSAFELQNPTFAVYTVAASIMILKLMGQGWMTVFRMIQSDGGLMNPEDLKPGPANRNPDPRQLEANESVERSRRMHRNDLESIPAFLVAGLLFVAVDPPFVLAAILMATFVVARLAHTVAYATAQRHEIRATFFSIGSIAVIVMAVYVLLAAVN